MDDWERLCGELDNYVTDAGERDEILRDPEDLREAKARFERFVLRNLLKYISRVTDQSGISEIKVLSKRCNMDEKEFRKHFSERDFFKACVERKNTYAEAKNKLKLRQISEIRKKVLVELEKLEAPISVRKLFIHVDLNKLGLSISL